MLRTAFFIFFLLHALIHLLGFVQGWGLARIEQMSGKTLFPMGPLLTKTAGAIWLAATLLLIAGAIAFLMKKDYWWIPALTGMVISQILIVIYWQDARFGTIPNILILLLALVGWGQASLNNLAEKELQALATPAPAKPVMLTAEMTSHLPVPVQKWLDQSGVIGREMIHSVSLKQTGEMRMQPGGKWLQAEAVQYFSIPDPGFVWKVRVTGIPLLHFAGLDRFLEGRGQMLIKVLSLFPVVDASGPEIDQGTMLRYLAEIVWFPTAALSSHIRWEPIDSTSARASFTVNNATVEGDFFFSENGDVLRFEAMRYYDRKEGSSLEKWIIRNEEDGYREFGGIRIPVRSSVTWALEEGDFTWFRVNIEDIRYNVPPEMK